MHYLQEVVKEIKNHIEECDSIIDNYKYDDYQGYSQADRERGISKYLTEKQALEGVLAIAEEKLQ